MVLWFAWFYPLLRLPKILGTRGQGSHCIAFLFTNIYKMSCCWKKPLWMLLAASFVLLPYYTFNYLVSSSGEGSRSSLADNSLLILLMLIHYRKCINMDNSSLEKAEATNDANGFLKLDSYFDENPYCRALENARDVECKFMPIWLLPWYLYFATAIFNPASYCSWPCRCGEWCTKWVRCKASLCFPVWHSWGVSIFLCFGISFPSIWKAAVTLQCKSLFQHNFCILHYDL